LREEERLALRQGGVLHTWRLYLEHHHQSLTILIFVLRESGSVMALRRQARYARLMVEVMMVESGNLEEEMTVLDVAKVVLTWMEMTRERLKQAESSL